MRAVVQRVTRANVTVDGKVAGAIGPGLFRHGVEMKLEGTYAEVLNWLRLLEEAPQKVLWGDVRYVVIEYPRAQVTLTVFTLSLDRSWLAI